MCERKRDDACCESIRVRQAGSSTPVKSVEAARNSIQRRGHRIESLHDLGTQVRAASYKRRRLYIWVTILRERMTGINCHVAGSGARSFSQFIIGTCEIDFCVLFNLTISLDRRNRRSQQSDV